MSRRASLNLKITVYGAKEAAENFERMGLRAAYLRPAFAEIAKLLLRGEQGLFRRQGGRRWEKLDRDTLRHKRGSPRKLVKSGRLMRSLTDARASNDAIRERHDRYMEFGTRVAYARFHQYGIGVPARPVLVFRPTDKTMARKLIGAHIVGNVNDAYEGGQ